MEDDFTVNVDACEYLNLQYQFISYAKKAIEDAYERLDAYKKLKHYGDHVDGQERFIRWTRNNVRTAKKNIETVFAGRPLLCKRYVNDLKQCTLAIQDCISEKLEIE